MTCSDFQMRVREVKNPCVSRKPGNQSDNYDELREVKGKGEKERYTHLNTEFQRIARKDEKALLRDQCKEIEGNNRMGKTRDLFKKIRDTKGIFHENMGKGQKWYRPNRSRRH